MWPFKKKQQPATVPEPNPKVLDLQARVRKLEDAESLRKFHRYYDKHCYEYDGHHIYDGWLCHGRTRLRKITMPDYGSIGWLCGRLDPDDSPAHLNEQYGYASLAEWLEEFE